MAPPSLAAALKNNPLISQKKTVNVFKLPASAEKRSLNAQKNIALAKNNPEILLTQTLEVETSPDVSSNQSFSFSLNEAILLALRYSPDLISAELDRIIARYQLKVSENEFELQYALSGGVNASWTKNQGVHQPLQNSSDLASSISRKSLLGGTTTLTMNHLANASGYAPQVILNFEQPLLRGAGKTVVERNLKDRQDQEWMNKLALKSTYINKVNAVISAYRALIQQKNAYETQKKSLKDAQYTVWVNNKRIHAGELEPAGNIQQEYQVSNLSLTLQSQKNQFQQSRRALLLLIGLDPTLKINVPSDVSVPIMVQPNLEKNTAYALANNISYLTALINYKMIKRSVLVAQNEQLWELTLSASHAYGASAALGEDRGIRNLTNGRNQSSQVGLRLTVPVNDLSRKSTLISAKISLEQARLALLAQKRQLKTEVIDKVVAIKNEINLYHMSVKQLDLAKRSYDIEIKKRQAGISSSLDVTNTQNQLISAQNSLTAAKIAYLEGVSSLELLLGTTLDVWRIKMRFT